MRLRSNQTVAGLKYLLIRWKDNVVLGSNQTVAGLKSETVDAMLFFSYKFKSDRCGIEIFIHSSKEFRKQSSNQTVAGLKYLDILFHHKDIRCSNQTVAGLK